MLQYVEDYEAAQQTPAEDIPSSQVTGARANSESEDCSRQIWNLNRVRLLTRASESGSKRGLQIDTALSFLDIDIPRDRAHAMHILEAFDRYKSSYSNKAVTSSTMSNEPCQPSSW